MSTRKPAQRVSSEDEAEARDRAEIAAIVASIPPPTPELIARLRRLFGFAPGQNQPPAQRG